MNTKPAAQPLVGEDGELLSPDTTADPNIYADYVATHVRRDPLWFRVRDNIRENGCAYLFFAPFIFMAICCIVIIFDGIIPGSHIGGEIALLGLAELLGIGLLFYWLFTRDNRR